MPISRASFAAFLIATVGIFVGVTHANEIDYLPDGNFDGLEVGTGPNTGSPAGSWELGVDPAHPEDCLLYTSPSPRDATLSRMPSSA